MCGIFGILNLKGIKNQSSPLNGMLRSLAHRGPDSCGTWADIENSLVIGHTRLAVQDLSDAAGQPFVSSSGRTVIVFNGEIYNHLELRSKIPNVHWKSRSDTETLVELVEYLGIENAAELLHGMFAFAVWDRGKSELTLMRDRFGEKPLYLGEIDGGVAFASEIWAFNHIPTFTRNINRSVLADYLQTGYVSGTKCIFEGCAKVGPGTFVKIDGSTSKVTSKKYYCFTEKYLAASSKKNLKTDDLLISLTEEKLLNSINMQTVSDVPVGAFLSGGIDSSLVCSMLSETLTGKLETFSIGFSDENYDESKFAKSVANQIGTVHHELLLSGSDALSVVPKLAEIYDEPFADSSQIPTVFLSELTRKHVTVAFSGDGADELFGGYNRYQLISKYWGKISLLPAELRKIFVWILLHSPTNKFKMFDKFNDKKLKACDAFLSRDIDDLYLRLTSPINDPNILLHDYEVSLAPPLLPVHSLPNCSNLERMMVSDTLGYLPDDILTKVDRAAMSVSLETRIPFLDHTVAEFAATLPETVKIRKNENKWILRQLLYKRLPRSLVDRPKMGFGVPLGEWMRGPLRDWCETLLEPSRIANEGYLNPDYVSKIWNEHLGGNRNWQYKLWIILVFQSWLENQLSIKREF